MQDKRVPEYWTRAKLRLFSAAPSWTDMNANMRAILFLILPAAALSALSALPASAQQSPRDFTLPPPPPSSADTAQGPVDDSGVVPVGPRTIPTERPVQQPLREATAEPAPASTTQAAPSSIDARTVREANRPGPVQTEPAPAASRPGPVTESPPPDLLTASRGEESSEPAQASALPPPLPSTQTIDDSTDRWAAMPAWQWVLAGLLALLFALVLAALALLRRRTAQRVPIIEPPLTNSGVVAAGGADLGQAVELAVDIAGLSRSLMTLTLSPAISIANRSAHALRDLSVHADITSAHRSLPAEQQLAFEGTALPLCATLERIGPHQSQTVQLSLQLT